MGLPPAKACSRTLPRPTSIRFLTTLTLSAVLHGGCRWTILGLTILSWILSVVSLASCNFLNVTISGTNVGTFGLFSAENSNGNCEKYGDNFEFVSAHKAGRAFGVIANLLLVLAFVSVSLVIFVLKEKAARMVWTTARILFVLALLSVLFTFSIFAVEECTDGDSVTCEPGGAGGANITNVFVLIGILSTVWCIPIPDEPMINVGRPRESNQNIPVSTTTPTPQVTKTVEMTPQGRKITEVVVNPDGSKTVTETFEEADDLPTEVDEESQSTGTGRLFQSMQRGGAEP